MEKINISLDKTTGIECNSCHGNVFNQGYILRKISRILTGSSEDSIQPILVFFCVKCNHVNKEFLPVQLQENENLKLV